MKETALGIIETYGFVPAVEAADIAAKTADVTLEAYYCVGAGRVSVFLRGDISAVKASVNAGAAAAERLGRVLSVTVIGRTAPGLETLFYEGMAASALSETKTAGDGSVSGDTVPPFPGEKPLPPDVAGLKKMSVARLRRLARTLDAPFSMARKKIKFARKEELVTAISDYYRQEKK